MEDASGEGEQVCCQNWMMMMMIWNWEGFLCSPLIYSFVLFLDLLQSNPNLLSNNYMCEVKCEVKRCLHIYSSTAFDVSADLTELGRSPVAVICAGVKSILDIQLTLEYLVRILRQLMIL